jgi:uncharacterized protein (TIGR00730 family)
MHTIRRVCVYGGSSSGTDAVHAVAARGLGAFLAGRGLGIVYGGGRVGLMGAMADGALAAGGEVIGVIPEKLQALELAHLGLTKLHVVDGMHSRKMLMAQLADAFIAMPGGFGTLEEVFEATTWTQLNYHKKPVGLLNVGGYYDALIGFLDETVREGFVHPRHRPLIAADGDPERLLKALEGMEIPDLKKWLDNP